MSELRWTLLILGAVFIGALAWWERHRPRQASGGRAAQRIAARGEAAADAAPRARREPTLNLPQLRARDPQAAHDLALVEAARDLPALPVLGPAPSEAAVHQRGANASAGLATDAADTEEAASEALAQATAAAAAGRAHALPAGVALESLPRLAPAPAPVVDWPPDERRHIVAVRLVAPQPERFAGRSLRQALAAEGFVLGRFAIFHKPDEEQRAVLSAASLTRPGTFDADTMDSQHYGGLSLFAVLPGPKPPPQAFDELVSTARNLSERLCGELQDEQGSPLTAARIALLRERLGAGTAS
ncbi:MAG TPA: cell division protein ZipA C-terminal FtsZ-binding domain-containing protein [Steroidobacteraceae bacterium]